MNLTRKDFVKCLVGGGAVLWLPKGFAAVNARNGVSITTASTINGRTPNSHLNGQTITSGAAPAWYDSVVLASTNSNSDFGPTSGVNALLAAKITLPTGNATKLRIGIKFGYSTGTAKLGLYDSSKNEVISTSVSIPATDDTTTEVSITSTAVTAGDYWVTCGSSTNQILVGMLTGQPSSAALITFGYGYSDMPLASISDWSTNTSVPSVGVYV